MSGKQKGGEQGGYVELHVSPDEGSAPACPEAGQTGWCLTWRPPGEPATSPPAPGGVQQHVSDNAGAELDQINSTSLWSLRAEEEVRLVVPVEIGLTDARGHTWPSMLKQ